MKGQLVTWATAILDWFLGLQIYLPIAEVALNVFLLLGLGAGVGILSGLFGVGGGFLLTPLLIFVGVPPAVAVATQSNQVVASSVSGVLAHWARGNVDVKMGTVMLVGGMEALSYVTLSGFNALGALSPTINRPFDLNRDGIVIGEAAAVLVLEPLERAKARGAHVFAEFVSYGLAADGNHITAPSPEGDGMARAMRTALRLGGLAPEAIAYINAHGTGTALNDASETAAIRRTFGAHADRLCLSSIKPMIGHTLSAAGAIEAAATVLSLAGQFAPPTLNYETPDPACDLDVVPNVARNLDMEYAMSNSLAFGGNNASLIFRRAEAA